MTEKYIEQAPGGELTTPAGTEKLPVTNGVTDYFMQLLNLVSRKLRETGGPTVLDMGAVGDGKFLKRSSTTIIGATPPPYPLYKIVPTLAGAAMNLAIKYIDGSDASVTRPIPFRVGDVEYSLEAAVSISYAAATNYLNCGASETAGQGVDFFVYAIGETGAGAGIKFAIARVPYGRVQGDLLNNFANEKGITGNASAFNATDPITVIGRFRATITAPGWSNITAIVNYPIWETDWLTYTPVLTASGGTLTSVTTTNGAYRVVGRALFYDHLGTIGTNGTGTGSIRLSLPFSPVVSNAIFPGRENAVTGIMLQARVGTAVLDYLTYNNGYPGGNGYSIVGGGSPLKLV